MSKRRSERPRNEINYAKYSKEDSDDDDFSAFPPRQAKKSRTIEPAVVQCKILEKPKQITCEKYIYVKENKDKSPVSLAYKENVSLMPLAAHKSSPKMETAASKLLGDTVDLTLVRLKMKTTRDGTWELTEKPINGCSNISTSERFQPTQKSTSCQIVEQTTTIEGKAYSPGAPCIASKDSSTAADVVSLPLAETSSKVDKGNVRRNLAASKWKAPGPANKDDHCSRANTVNSPGAGLRLGLSRYMKVKPLHTNVKAIH